ncbi:Gfo/Idh/MocA family protein [Maritalea sp.]|uniref:Gfo/Idh/MocA family protein n=1 Tax=Maritalea sp. TaxID=2003361 RepID=UPI003EF9EDB3
MVGGGQGAFIGAVHRIAARLDDRFELVAGALSSNAERAAISAAQIGVSPDRSYASFEEMAKVEAAREDGIEAVSVVTPNYMHFPVSKAFLDAGISVICDKPLTANLEEAIELGKIAESSRAEFILTHNYSGYPMVRQAREMVRSGKIGKLRRVQVEYVQDWLSAPIDLSQNKQAEWRADPKRSGAGGAIADVGTHAFQLSQFICGTPVSELAAELTSFVDGRLVDDDAQILLRFKNGAKGTLWATQVAPGNENALSIRIFGETGGLEWHQENPNQLWVSMFGEPKCLLTRGGHGTSAIANDITRVPPGHPEGYLEGFATIYSEAADIIRNGRTPNCLSPTIDEGIAGMRFIDAAIRSSKANAQWTPLVG